LETQTTDMTLPRGVADYLPARGGQLSALEQKVLQIAARWGFQRVVPPALEFEDVLAIGMGDGLRARTFRFDDWQSGRLLAIPPDITPQIARIVATRLKEQPLPYRISYSGRVLRHAELQSGRSREIMQAGVELIGLDAPEADAEMVAMAVEVMQSVGLQKVKVDLGQVAFCQGVFAAAGLQGEPLKQLREAVSLKDVSSVARLLKSYPVNEESRQELLALPRLFGGCEILEEAARVVHNPQSLAALVNIREVIAILALHGVQDCLTIDLGETRGLDYHTGLTFEGFVAGVGEALFSGGRYDGLTARYGLEAPATGFTCNLLSLMQALEMQGVVSEESCDLLVFATDTDHCREALEVSREMRTRGYSAARDSSKRDLAASLQYACKVGIKAVLVVGEQDQAHTYRLIRAADGSEQQLNNVALWQLYPAKV